MNIEKINKWLSKVFEKTTTIEDIAPLKGGISSHIYLIRTNDNERMVLRQFTNREWLKHSPDLALHEARSLECAALTGVPSPRIIAFDEKGTDIDYPTVLMSMLEGDVVLTPENPKEWIGNLAATLVKIHDADIEIPWKYYTYNQDLESGDLAWSSVPEKWLKAIEILKGEKPKTKYGFIHRDYHPTNVLWKNNRVTGVVDWVNACIGPLGVDVGHCRLNLALLYGVETADDFLKEYIQLSRSDFAYHPYWDLLSLIEVLPGPPEVYRGWTDLNITSLTNNMMIERVDQYLLSLLEKF